MAYKALYRTYRPSTFEEVAGQQHIVRTLKNAIATGKIAHAYLFAGPRGTGKTTMAKLFAKALNCEEGIGHQCNVCKNCKSINEGSHPDVVELDAASNNGVNNIRDIVEKVKYGTLLGRYKVYIIDEVHMLTDEAFNALLKTLEEPPEHVIFILATTDPNEILPTVLSRCQRYDFTKISEEDLVRRMEEVLESENITYDEEALKIIAALADGGCRDALSMLDQIIAYSKNGVVSIDDVLEIFSLESTQSKIQLLKTISEGNSPEAISMINAYFTKGSDIKRLTSDLLYILKDTLIYTITRRSDTLQQLAEPQALGLSRLFNESQLEEMIKIVLETLKDYSTVSSINPIFEVTILKLCSLCSKNFEKHAKNEKITAKTQEIIENDPLREPLFEEKQIEIIKPENIVKEENKEFKKIDHIIELVNIRNDTTFNIDDELMLKVMIKSNKQIKKDMIDSWGSLRKLTSHPILGGGASNIQDAHPLVVSQKIAILEVSMPSQAEKLNAIANQEEVQNIMLNAFGKQLFVYFVSRKKSVELQNMYNSLFQVNKLPKADSINLEFLGD